MRFLRYRRMRLRRDDGQIFLDRWGLQVPRKAVVARNPAWCGVFLHLMWAPDPGIDIHDHPWTFVTLPIFGGYIEERAPAREAMRWARDAERFELERFDPDGWPRGVEQTVKPRSVRLMRLDECHRIIRLTRRFVVTVVVHGPTRRNWGFYTSVGFDDETTYDSTHSRPLSNDMALER